MHDHDFAAAWHALTHRDPNHRADPADDIAFWQTCAAEYDESQTQRNRYAQTLAAIAAHIKPTDTLLDIGAGTGRYAIPLAAIAKRITAIDHAAPMLDVLNTKINHDQIDNIDTHLADWESANYTMRPHDVVLAAWSLYRATDLVNGFKQLAAVTNRTLIVVLSPGSTQPTADDTPMHVYFYGAMWQAGLHADVQIVWEYPHDQATPVALLVWNRPDFMPLPINHSHTDPLSRPAVKELVI